MTTIQAPIIWSYPVQVVRTNCHKLVARYPDESVKNYTGSSAYESMLSDLYDAGYFEAFYNLRDDSMECPTLEHTCGATN
jgi:hypothetical protein